MVVFACCVSVLVLVKFILRDYFVLIVVFSVTKFRCVGVDCWVLIVMVFVVIGSARGGFAFFDSGVVLVAKSVVVLVLVGCSCAYCGSCCWISVTIHVCS